MENKILYINSCIRPASRTAELARCVLDKLSGDITEVNIYAENIKPLDAASLDKRDSKDYSDEDFNLAKQFALADVIVVAAPFWDLSFPALLKVYLENITVAGITFEYSKEGRPVSKCKAKKLCYVTTSGGYIGNNNYGFDYVKALCTNFFGIEDVVCFTAEGLDIYGADVTSIMNEAKKNILF